MDKMSGLDTNLTDRMVSVAKAVAGAVPVIGSFAAEAIGSLIPAQRVDRVVEYLKQLEVEVTSRLDEFEKNVRTPEGLDVLEEGLMQAARSVASERKARLARLVGRSLTADEMDYAESRKLLNLFRELTDPELVWLIFFSMNPTLGTGPHSEFMAKHPEVLTPISREIGAPQDQRDRAALQDSYKNTLARLGLIEHDGRSYRITALGRLMVGYVNEHES